MRMLDEHMVAILAVGLLSSTVLLAAGSFPPSLTVSELWALNEDSSLTVSGILVSLRTHESGSETLVISDLSGEPTVKVVCGQGPGPPPSDLFVIGDLLEVSGRCVFESGTPVVYCQYGDVRVLLPSEEVLTVGLLSVAWHLFEWDRITVRGVSVQDASGGLRLHDAGGTCSIQMVLGSTVVPVEGDVVVEGTLHLDATTMAIVLEVSRLVSEH